MTKEKRVSLNIKMSNLTTAQSEAIQEMLAQWIDLSAAGGSRWVCFYADGDGNFHPKITINGEKPKHGTHVDPREWWKNNESYSEECRIDFDRIAWREHDD